MQKYIHRRLSFSAQEIREILTLRLSELDKPYPGPTACDVKFTLSADGATIQWGDDCEENV